MNPDQDLADLVTKLKDAAGSNLLCATLYGSAATEEFHEGHSDLNVLCIVKALGRSELDRFHEPSAWWMKKGNPAPLFMTLEELQHAADLFAIELLDIIAARRVLTGEDVFASLDIPLDLHRHQVERALRHNTLRLRQHYLQQPNDAQKVLGLMTSSISTFATLFRHALIALGEDPPTTKRDAIDRVSKLLGFDPAPFHTIYDIREGPRGDAADGNSARVTIFAKLRDNVDRQQRERGLDIDTLFEGYLAGVEKATEEMDRRLAGK